MLMKSESALQIMLVSVSWFGYCSLVVQDTVIVGGWSMWDLSVHFSFATSSESVIILKYKGHMIIAAPSLLLRAGTQRLTNAL